MYIFINFLLTLSLAQSAYAIWSVIVNWL